MSGPATVRPPIRLVSDMAETPRRRFRVKKLLIGIGLLFLVLVVAIVAAPFVVPTDTYKAQAVAEIKRATGRDLRIDGPVSFSLLPQLALSAQDVSFANAPGGGAPVMAKVKSLEIRLQLRPRLSISSAIDSLVLVDPTIALEIDKRGRANWQFDEGTEARPHAAPASGSLEGFQATIAGLRIAKLQIQNGSASYVDARGGKKWSASAINMTFSMAGLDSPLAAEGSAVWNGETIAFDYQVARPAAFEGGEASALRLKMASRPINIDFTGTGVGAPKLKLAGKVNLSVPSVRHLAKWTGLPIAEQGTGLGPLSIQGTLDVEGSVYGFGKAQIALDALRGTGGIVFDNSRARPGINGSLLLEALDVNPYLGAPAAEKGAATGAPADSTALGAAAPATKNWSEAPIDLSMLKLADVYFELGTGSIRYRKVSVGESALNFDLKGGRLAATMTKLTLYGGGGTGKVTIDGTGAVPAIEENFSLKGVDLGPLLSDIDNITVLTGAASVDLAVRGSGNSPRDITASLAGKGNLHLGKGALKGIDLIDKAQHAASVLSLGLAGTRTDFDSLDATFTVANGVLKNDDLKLTAADLPVTGAGTVDLPRRQVDYRLTPKLGGVLTVPVAISGPWDNLRYDTETIDIITAPVRALGNAIINLFAPDSDSGGATGAGSGSDSGSSKPQ